MDICVLASGSEGNVTYIGTPKHKILLDLGTNVKYITNALEEINIKPEEIDTVIISHIHDDHIKAVKQFIKKYNPNLYMTKGMIEELPIDSSINDYKSLVIYDDDFFLDDVKVGLIKTSHDVKDSRGFIVSLGSKSVVYLTDTGYLNQKYFDKLRNKNVYLFESNHDIEMLMNGKYPKWLKDRIVGPYGHLSNKDASIYLTKLVGEDTKNIILMHLSEHNNTKEKAIETIKDVFDEYNVQFNNIKCASQKERCELITI